jgi:CheY-like chemotaxis protein
VQLDGLEAVNKLNNGAKYDLVLMDIIMPNLDGVSATHLIRQFDNTPIIAMTSNIRSDDISMYFQHGRTAKAPHTLASVTDFVRNERCTTKAFHERGSIEYAREALVASQEAPT